MDLKKYDKLRKKINTKDFEGNNKGLDKWLFIFSFIGNISSIFFAYFLVFPSLLKAITANFITGNIGTGIAFGLTLVFLSIFEIIKRYFIKNFSNDFVTNNRNISFKMVSWLLVSITVIILSFYLSISGSKNLASTSSLKNIVAKTEVVTEIDTLESVYYKRKLIYIEDNEALREVNRELRQTLAESPLNYVTARKEYQASIDKNTELIGENDMKIKAIDVELQKDINVLNVDLDVEKSGNENEDSKNIVLFAIIVCLNELIIIGGLYFREFFEYNLFLINQDRFEKMYQKKDRYRILTTFIYNNGKLTTGDRVMSGLELKNFVKQKANIQNKFIDEYLYDMDNMGIFCVVGKRRDITKTYEDALNIINNFDNIMNILEELK